MEPVAKKSKGERSSISSKVTRTTPKAGQRKRPRKTRMGVSRFWKLIEEARLAHAVHSTLTATLKKLSAEEIVAFENIFRRKLAKAYVFPLLSAAFVIESYVSDDAFESFRAWLMSQGRQRFEGALSEPESICDWLDRKDVNRVDRDGERMLFVASNAFKRYGDEEDFDDQTEYPHEPTLKQKWPESKAGFRKKYPRLVDKFWNQSRIEELHSI